MMKNNRRGLLVRHMSGDELDQAIVDAQQADETRLVRRLCYVKNLYAGDTREEAGDRVGSLETGRSHLRASPLAEFCQSTDPQSRRLRRRQCVPLVYRRVRRSM